MAESQRDRIVRALSSDGSPLCREAIALCVDVILATKLRDLVDLDVAHTLVVEALTSANIERVVLRHAHPAVGRVSKYVETSEATVGDLVPDPTRPKIAALVRTLRLPRARWAKGAVDPDLFRRLLTPVWTNLLSNFVKRLPLPGVGQSAPETPSRPPTIAERLTRSVQERAEKLVDAGRTVMSGIGGEVEKRFSAAAREFSDGAAGLFWQSLDERLKSEEGRRLLDEIKTEFVEHVMQTELRDLWKDVLDLPVDQVFSLASEVVPHAKSRDFVRELGRLEVRAFVEAEGERPLGEILVEVGVRDEVRRVAMEQADGTARAVFSSPAFADWLERLLDT